MPSMTGRPCRSLCIQRENRTLRTGAVPVIHVQPDAKPMKQRLMLAACAAALVVACSRDSSDIRLGDAARAVAQPAAADAARMMAASHAPRQAIADLPDAGRLARYSAPGLPRMAGAYVWHPVRVSEEHVLAAAHPAGKVSLQAPDGRLLDFGYSRHVEHANGDWTWIGRTPGTQGQEAIITFGEKAAFGSISQGMDRVPLRLTTRDGALWIVDADAAKLADLGHSATEPVEGDSPLPPLRISDRRGGVPGAQAAQVMPAAAGDTVVDLLLGYTNGFAAALGGDSQARTRLAFLVEVGNQAYLNSGIPAQLRLVHAMAVDYPDATSSSKTLDELTGVDSARKVRTTPNPAFNALRAARETHGADLVQLVRKFQTPEAGNCGIAWLNGGNGEVIVPSQDEYYGYSVIGDGTDRDEGDGKNYYCRDETMVHELGHNMGSAHDIGSAGNGGAYPYSRGYKAGAASGNFYTVMAYGDTGQTSYRLFSNPDTTFCGGHACGLANQADNARSLRQTIPLIAQFRAATTEPPPPPPRRTRYDINGDGRADIFWQNKAAGDSYWWLMNGLSRIGAAGRSVTGSFRIAAIADFNGDGRDDVLWEDGLTVWIWLSQGDQFTGHYVSQYPAGGWTLAGAGDLNRDGRADLVWNHRGSGEAYWWYMNGITRIGAGGRAVPSEYAVAGVADLDGDGADDILWQGSSDIWLWRGGSNGVGGGQFVTRNPVGWLIAGLGDVNGDGRADIVWQNRTLETTYVWLMSGTQRTGAGGRAVPARFNAAMVADFDGDGRAEVLWEDQQTLWQWRWQGSDFASHYLGLYPAGGWIIGR